ncbi:hypothetical protein BGZ82_003926 [Podila clonocystis]|nr:hypothetical protein BGZ82_003926 [Podila clonocystis]
MPSGSRPCKHKVISYKSPPLHGLWPSNLRPLVSQHSPARASDHRPSTRAPTPEGPGKRWQDPDVVPVRGHKHAPCLQPTVYLPAARVGLREIPTSYREDALHHNAAEYHGLRGALGELPRRHQRGRVPIWGVMPSRDEFTLLHEYGNHDELFINLAVFPHLVCQRILPNLQVMWTGPREF